VAVNGYDAVQNVTIDDMDVVIALNRAVEDGPSGAEGRIEGD
jgi:hypothetical protein